MVDSVRRITSQYSFQSTLDQTNEDFSCIICRNLKLDIYQAYCGCVYCQECVKSYLKDGNKYCIGAKSECKEEYLSLEINIVLSPLLNRKIIRQGVFCPNSLCQRVIDLCKMEEHLRVCAKQSFDCPFRTIGCANEGEPKDHMTTHLNIDIFSHSKLLMDFINHLNNEFRLMKDNFEMSKLEIDNLKERLSSKDVELVKLNKEVEKQRGELVSQRREIERLRGDSVKINKYETMRSQDEGSMNKVEVLSEIVEKLNIGTNKMVSVGAILFTVDQFASRLKSASDLFSPFFYSHTNGYKLRIKVNVGGHKPLTGTKLSACFQICKGEYDDLLQWPFESSIHISVFNQSTGEEHSRKTYNHASALEGHKYLFNKPINKNNDAYGHPSLMSHNEIFSTLGIFLNDSVVIKCHVTSANRCNNVK